MKNHTYCKEVLMVNSNCELHCIPTKTGGYPDERGCRKRDDWKQGHVGGSK